MRDTLYYKTQKNLADNNTRRVLYQSTLTFSKRTNEYSILNIFLYFQKCGNFLGCVLHNVLKFGKNLALGIFYSLYWIGILILIFGIGFGLGILLAKLLIAVGLAECSPICMKYSSAFLP